MGKAISKLTRLMTATAAAVLAAYIWYCSNKDVTNVEVKGAVTEESAAIQSRVDDRCEALEVRLDRIEGKIDKLLEIVSPRLPDGLVEAP